MSMMFLHHDLLRIDLEGVKEVYATSESFCGDWLHRSPFVVVRRTQWRNGRIPVGMRGWERSERVAAWLSPENVVRKHSPESVRTKGSIKNLPAFTSLLLLERGWRDIELSWGPVGSVGFEMVSGTRAVRESSDLDIIVRAPAPLSNEAIRLIEYANTSLECPVDIQIETPFGSFASREYLNGGRHCMLRTIDGPRMVADPWHPEIMNEVAL
jgi:phosphoribosyl-dephospho-CoA transferase